MIRKVRISAMCKCADKFFCFAKDINLLFELDANSFKTHVLCSLPESEKGGLIDKILLWDNKIILIPLNAQNIYIYDLNSTLLESIELPVRNGTIYFKFFWGCIRNDKLFLIGSYYPAIVRVDLHTKKIHEINVYNDRLNKQKQIGDCFTRKSIVEKENELFIASAISNEVLIYNMVTDEYRWEKVGSDGNRYSGIAWDGKAFWLSPRKHTSIVRWILGVGIEEFDISRDYQEGNNFGGVVYYDDKIYILSLESDFSLIFDVSKGQFNKLKTGEVSCFEVIDDKLFCQFDDRLIHVMTREEEKIVECDWEGVYDTILKSDMKWNYFFREGSLFDLKMYLKEIYKNN